MSETIQVNTEGAAAVASSVRQSLGEYCGFVLDSISGTCPVAGSDDHDGGIAESFAGAMTTWNSLIESDAQALTSAGAQLEQADNALARLLGGE